MVNTKLVDLKQPLVAVAIGIIYNFLLSDFSFVNPTLYHLFFLIMSSLAIFVAVIITNLLVNDFYKAEYKNYIVSMIIFGFIYSAFFILRQEISPFFSGDLTLMLSIFIFIRAGLLYILSKLITKLIDE